MPSTSFKLYVLKNADYDAVTAKYRQLCEEGISFYDGEITIDGQDDTKLVYRKEPRQPLKDDARIRNKAIYLMHTIIYRQQTSRENNDEGASLQASIMQAVLKEDFYEILKAFIELGYVAQSSVYIVGKSSRRYRAIGDISTEPCSNHAILKYINHTRELLNEKIEKRLASPSFRKEYGDKFAETYVRNLNRFKIADINGFNKFATERIKNNPDTEAYYDFVRESFKNKLKIYRIDDNNRIYHILTSLKRELKQYINIRFSIDCSNSHPLLFNYFIFRYKKISIQSSYTISTTLSNIVPSFLQNDSPTNTHYDIQKLRNVLIDSGLRKSEISRFKDDELLYMWKTTIGTFWDDILANHQDEDLDRAELKKKMFGEVFYSRTPKKWWKRFANEFGKQYPNVYELILKWQHPRSHPELAAILLRRNRALELNGHIFTFGDDDTTLPNIMMELESVIFRNILKTLYSKRICSVHIHDAIVVPETKSTEKVEAEKVEDVMREAYKSFGLHPSFKVEKYR